MSLFKLVIEGSNPQELLENLRLATQSMATLRIDPVSTEKETKADVKTLAEEDAAREDERAKSTTTETQTRGRGRGRSKEADKEPEKEKEKEVEKEEKKTTTRRTRGASKAVEETEEQKELRAQIMVDASDLADVPEAIPRVTEYLQRKGCKLVSDLLVDDLEDAAAFLEDLCVEYFPEDGK